jgi:hypothetical protein
MDAAERTANQLSSIENASIKAEEHHQLTAIT